jgi:uncharacterized protein YkwD
MIGENLAWRTGQLSPRAVVSAWLASRPHPRILLQPAYRAIGIGMPCGTPFGSGADAATYTAELGS